jgi:flagellar biosynthesis anti-sigma factor FlgM
MKIDPIKAANIYSCVSKEIKNTENLNKSAPKTDRIELSDKVKSQNIQSGLKTKVVSDLGRTDMEKIEKLRNSIKSGSYQIDAQKIAGAILGDKE